MNDTARLGPTRQPPRLQLGDMAITVLDGGHLMLDGGAMFGIIPKPLWSRAVAVDGQNRIPLAMTCLLVETANRRILVETGAGGAAKFDEKERGFFQFSDESIHDALAAIGVEPGSIDTVILTHLHFDHAGGGTCRDRGGGFVPAFSNARYVVQSGEWRDAVDAHAVMTGTYRRENLEPLEAGGVLSLVDGVAEIAPGITLRPLPGHTRHQQGLWLESGGRTIVHPADMIPTSAHAGLRHNMAYDLMPFENMQNKSSLLAACESNGWQLLLGQDPDHVLWQASRDERGRPVLIRGGMS